MISTKLNVTDSRRICELDVMRFVETKLNREVDNMLGDGNCKLWCRDRKHKMRGVMVAVSNSIIVDG